MSSLGIYFGIKDINLVETQGKKILNNIRLPHPNSGVTELEEKVPVDIKLTTLLKDAFRTYRIKADEAAICISGQDLVIRTFEIPQIPQNELKGVVSFEVKKYIPFKLEELDYDFQVLSSSRNKTSLVLFVGIKKEILNKYVAIFKELNIKIGLLEYSAFSILRFIKMSGVNESGIKASLCFDLNNEDEANFTVFENGFSLFSRDFVLTGEPSGFEQVAEADRIQRLEKLKNEIKISLDYYKRKYPDKGLKEIHVVSDKESQVDLNAFSSETSIPIKFVDTQKVLGKDSAYSSVLVKSYAASLFKTASAKIKISLISAKLKATKAVPVARQPISFEGLKIDFKYIVLGVIACGLVFGYFGVYKVQPIKKEIIEIQDRRVKIKSPVEDDSIEGLSEIGSRYSKKIRALDELVKKQAFATYPLNAIPPALPRGVWLENLNFNQTGPQGPELVMSGKVYLADSQKEIESVNLFVANLKKDQAFSDNFKVVNINSIDRVSEGDKSLLVFNITCRVNGAK